MNAVLIQQASGDYLKMLELTAAWHAAYARRHGLRYWNVRGKLQRQRPAHWDKVLLIQEALQMGLDPIVWLDADTLIVRPEESVVSALRDGPPIAMCAHPWEWNGRPWHYNSGVMVIRNTPLAWTFFEEVWQAGPVDHPWQEQIRILEVAEKIPGTAQRLHDRWNSTVGVTDCADAVIKAWHGQGPGAVCRMEAEYKALTALGPQELIVEQEHLGNFSGSSASFSNRSSRSNEAHFPEENRAPSRRVLQVQEEEPLRPETALSRAEDFVRTISDYAGGYAGRGIVIPGGGADYFTCAWVCINMLRHLSCGLPIQLWHLGPAELNERMRQLVEPLGVESVDAFAVRRQFPARILSGWELKPYALIHCPFKEVLLLDADNVPVVNPEYLFDTPEFAKTGAVFWPDYGRLPLSRAIWRLCGVEYRCEPEFESGQILVDKSRCWPALQLCMWYNEHSDFYYRHIHGDKDTFHMAFRKLNQPYIMPERPIHPLHGAMCQHDFAGRRVFQHRNCAKWRFAGENQPVPGFLFEAECKGYLAELKRRWDGGIQLPVEPRINLAAETPAFQFLTSRVFDYHRIGHDRRLMSFLRGGRIGIGADQCEVFWRLAGTEDLLEIYGHDAITCRLKRMSEGLWQGRWLRFEKAPVELRASACSDTKS